MSKEVQVTYYNNNVKVIKDHVGSETEYLVSKAVQMANQSKSTLVVSMKRDSDDRLFKKELEKIEDNSKINVWGRTPLRIIIDEVKTNNIEYLVIDGISLFGGFYQSTPLKFNRVISLLENLTYEENLEVLVTL